jgi:hypothetical protein
LWSISKNVVTYRSNRISHVRRDLLIVYFFPHFLGFFSNFFCYFFYKSQYFFSNLNSNCSNLLDLRNLQEQVKKSYCYQKLFWPFTVWINFSSNLKNFANSRPSALNFKSFSQPVEQFFLTVVGKNNLNNKIPFFHSI